MFLAIVILQWYQKVSYCRIHQQTLPSGSMKDVHGEILIR
jgi:hypothetical protein